MRLYSRDADRAAPDSIRIAERERPATVHHAVHASREAEETRVDKHIERDPHKILNSIHLEAPPPRNGFRQRWIRDGSTETTDSRTQGHWLQKKRQGWAVRDPETIPPELRDFYPTVRLGSGQDAIRVAGQVLCEMPERVINERSMAIRQLITQQTLSVPPSTTELDKNRPRAASPIQVTDEVHAARGQNPELRGRNLATMAE